MQILITGGTGFIGSRLALACLERGHRVRILGQENTSGEAQNRSEVAAAGADLILGSVTDRDAVLRAVQGVEWVFHLAAAQHEAGAPDHHFEQVNIAGTRALVEASLDAGVQRFVHGSTIGVYGAGGAGLLDEASPPAPDNIYGITKLEAERVVQSYAARLQAVILRISETYGPGDRRLIKLFQGLQRGVFFVIGRGDNLHHLVYIDDLVQGMLQAAKAEAGAGETFVLAGPEPVTTQAMVAAAAKQIGTSPPRWKAPMPVLMAAAALTEAICRPLGIQPPLHRRRMDFFRKNYAFSLARARTVLNYEPQVGLQEGMAATARWYIEKGYIHAQEKAI